MRNPLTKRLPRELRNNMGKYLGIYLLMAGSIALVSGFLLAASSINVIMSTMRDDYVIEDARFTLDYEATDGQLDAARDAAQGYGGAEVVPITSVDAALEQVDGSAAAREATVRAYAHRTQVDVAAYAQGRAPQTASEVAVDRVFASHNGIHVGGTVKLAGRELSVVGIMTLPDQQALFENNSDFTINALSFGVAEVSDEGLAALEEVAPVSYTYAIVFGDRTMSAARRTDAEADVMEALADHDARVSDFIDADANQGIGYAADDVEGDSSMWEMMMAIIIVIMGFVFVVLSGAQIEEESAIIGTLLASGWRTREIVAHYLATPALVGALACACGTGLGLTLLEQPMKGLYYNSYSLPPYHMTWSWRVFAMCTAVPFALLVGVTLVGLLRKMGRTPLQFLRHELGRGGTRRGVRLPARLGFVARFRLRVFLRNLGNFATLFVGIAFASMLLLFGLAIMPTMNHYSENLRSGMVAAHQYTLKRPVDLTGTDEARASWEAYDRLASVSDIDELGLTGDERADFVRSLARIDEDDHAVNLAANSSEAIEQAESYGIYQLQYDRGQDAGYEGLSVYGIREDSRYWKGLDVAGGRVVVGAGIADKYGLGAGDTITLWDKYTDTTYRLKIDGTWGTKSDLNVYLGLDTFNTLLGNASGYFNAIASDEPLDIGARWLASELTPADMDKIGEQMTDSMGDMMYLLMGIAVFIFLIFIYLLTKAVIDRSARSISYMKVFGYRGREVSHLYVRSITWCVVASLLLTQPLLIGALTAIFRSMLYAYNGNIEIFVPAGAMAQCVLTGFATYVVAALLHLRSIRRMPMSLALKVQE